jgi:hypothetical protein
LRRKAGWVRPTTIPGTLRCIYDSAA